MDRHHRSARSRLLRLLVYHRRRRPTRILPTTAPSRIFSIALTSYYVQAPLSLTWEISEVPHGEIHHHFYKSGVVGDDRGYFVYTPPGYDPRGKQTYPVLYLLHGYSDNAEAWTAVGRANIILDNLIAQGKAKPMLMVMPLGYGRTENS